MKVPFNEASYLAQVRRLRNLARIAISQYPVQVKSINFIRHGENTTFRIDAKDGRTYLLRIHRNEYHTKSAIEEEMSWLALLSKAGLTVPKPVISTHGDLVRTVAHLDLPTSRNCSLFEWIKGRLIGESVSTKHLYQVGVILANFHTHAPRTAVIHRRYWTSEGLVGERPSFGSIDSLAGIRPKQQEAISRARILVLKKLRRFEKDFPQKQGLIHADLHFGNILSIGKSLGAIDFDDCGYGFHSYDLVIPLLSVERLLGERKSNRLSEYKNALISGYQTKKKWDADDERIFPYLFTARRLAMLGWLNSRSDNPRLKAQLRSAVDNGLKHLRIEHHL